jgi:hypothetical protein
MSELPARWAFLQNAEDVAYFADHNTHTTSWRDSRNEVFGRDDVQTRRIIWV